jgi:hypothetical protein
VKSSEKRWNSIFFLEEEERKMLENVVNAPGRYEWLAIPTTTILSEDSILPLLFP